MGSGLKIFLIVDLALAVLFFLYILLKKPVKKAESKAEDTKEEPAIEDKAEPIAEEAKEEPVEEVAAAEAVEETEEPTEEAEEEVEEETEDQDDAEEGSGAFVGAEGGSADRIRRVPFAEKMLLLPTKVQGYYDDITNEFLSYRNVHARVSQRGTSYRFGRKLIAKIVVRGKTMKLALDLNINDFDYNIYFQKDMSEVKAFEEVPFTVKVKSDRGGNNALKLVAAVAEKNEMKKKRSFERIDSMAAVKEAYKK